MKQGTSEIAVEDHVAAYRRDGFAVLQHALAPEDIAEVRRLIEPLFADFGQRLSARVRDVGALGGIEPGTQQPEIDRATLIAPALFRTAVYRRTRDIASQILGRRARYVFDHLISKMPNSTTSTAWHQDRGYMKAHTSLDTVNFWIPLQPVSPENGTLNYVPGSHCGEFLPHERDPDLHPHVLTAKVGSARIVSPSLDEGDLCFHHPLTIHSAGANRTGNIRYAWSIHFGAYGRLEYLKPSNLWAAIKRKRD